MAALIAATKGWIEQPFRSDMDLVHWVLFFGLVIGALVFWGIVLRHVGE